MWVFAEVVDRTGTVLARAEGELKKEGDMAEISRRALDRFHQAFPGQSVLSASGAEFTLRFGEAPKSSIAKQ